VSMSSNSTTINLIELLSCCIDVTNKAGALIRKVWKSGKLGVQDKGGGDPMTVADTQSQQLIIGALSKHFGKDLQFVGEEDCTIPVSDVILDDSLVSDSFATKIKENLPNCQQLPIKDLCVIIDPLDATLEFTRGNHKAVMTLVGISYKGSPLAGIAYQPFVDDPNDASKGTMMYGVVGVGCVGVPGADDRSDPDALVLTCSRKDCATVTQLIEVLKPDRVQKEGGAGYKIFLVISGQVDLFANETGTKKWDTCAPEALLLASGGHFTDLTGENYPYFVDSPHPNTKGILASGPKFSKQQHQAMIEKIQSSRKQSSRRNSLEF